MNDDKIRVLLIDEDPASARVIQNAFANAGGSLFVIERVAQISDALERLVGNDVDVVLLGLKLPAGIGIESVKRIVQAAPRAIVLILGGAKEDAEDARQAIALGAHDYLTRGRFDPKGLPQFVGYVTREKAARDAQRIAETRFQAMSAASPLGICITDAQGVCLFTNAAYHKLSGLRPEKVLGYEWSQVVHPKDRQRALGKWRKGLQTQAPFQIEFRFLRVDRRIVWVRAKAVAMRDGGQAYGYVLTMEDITERKVREFVLRAKENSLFEEIEFAQATLDSISDAVITVDIHGRISYLNPAAETMTGRSRHEALGLPATDVLRMIDGTTRAPADNPVLRALHEHRTIQPAASSLLLRRDGSELRIVDSAAPICNADGHTTGAVIVLHDATASQAMSKKIGPLAEHDPLTGLPNRLLLSDRLARAIELAHRQRNKIALLCMDIDYFKHINDSLGYLIGDQLLQSVSRRLLACVRSMDTVCRQGGDEFVLLLAEIENPQDAIHIAEKLLAAVAEPHIIDAHVLHVTLSIGISIYPEDGDSAAAIIQGADTAMYHAKTLGRNGFQFFRSEMNDRAVHRLRIEQTLRRALKNREFVLHYQPKVNFVTGSITGAEALLRWQDPDHGLVFPAQFIQIAEESGLIVPIGQWVLREACQQVQIWLDAGLEVVPVAVNISAAEFRNSGFLEGLVLILLETGMAPHNLQLELTESVLMHNVDASVATLEILRSMGLSLAIDDFGTGYSSLSYLQRFPVSTLKIDQSFVNNIATNRDDATIVNAVIAMGRNLNQQVIAEGVETDEQFSILQAQLCDEGQGFHFSPPLPAEAFGRLLG